MTLAHLTLATRDVQRTAAFLEQTLGYPRDPYPGNIPSEAAWLSLGRGQQIHLILVEDFAASPFENEFGRHVAVFYPLARFAELKEKLRQLGAEIFEPMRFTPFERFFFRDPVNGYVFEVIDQARAGLIETDTAPA